jgi:hypothetical protein
LPAHDPSLCECEKRREQRAEMKEYREEQRADMKREGRAGKGEVPTQKHSLNAKREECRGRLRNSCLLYPSLLFAWLVHNYDTLHHVT